MPRRPTRETNWKLDPGLVAINLGTWLKLSDAAWRELTSTPPTSEDRFHARKLAIHHFGEIAKRSGKSGSEIASLLKSSAEDPDLISRAHVARTLCSRYQTAIEAFAKAYRLTAAHKDAVERQYHVMSLIEACEETPTKLPEDDDGLIFWQQLGALKGTRHRNKIAASFSRAAQDLRDHHSALALSVGQALSKAQLFERSSMSPLSRLEGALWAVLNDKERQGPKICELTRAVVDTLNNHGVDVRKLDHEYRANHPKTLVSPKFPGNKVWPARLAEALAAVADELKRPLKSEQASVRIGNLDFSGSRRRLSDLARMDLVANLVIRLTRMAKSSAGKWRPTGHSKFVPPKKYPRSVFVITAAFVSDKLGRRISSDTIEKAIEAHWPRRRRQAADLPNPES